MGVYSKSTSPWAGAFVRGAERLHRPASLRRPDRRTRARSLAARGEIIIAAQVLVAAQEPRSAPAELSFA